MKNNEALLKLIKNYIKQMLTNYSLLRLTALMKLF